MPKATMNHGDFLLPMKNELLSALREVKYEMPISNAKYATMVIIIASGVMRCFFD